MPAEEAHQVKKSSLNILPRFFNSLITNIGSFYYETGSSASNPSCNTCIFRLAIITSSPFQETAPIKPGDKDSIMSSESHPP